MRRERQQERQYPEGVLRRRNILGYKERAFSESQVEQIAASFIDNPLPFTQDYIDRDDDNAPTPPELALRWEPTTFREQFLMEERERLTAAILFGGEGQAEDRVARENRSPRPDSRKIQAMLVAADGMRGLADAAAALEGVETCDSSQSVCRHNLGIFTPHFPAHYCHFACGLTGCPDTVAKAETKCIAARQAQREIDRAPVALQGCIKVRYMSWLDRHVRMRRPERCRLPSAICRRQHLNAEPVVAASNEVSCAQGNGMWRFHDGDSDVEVGTIEVANECSSRLTMLRRDHIAEQEAMRYRQQRARGSDGRMPSEEKDEPWRNKQLLMSSLPWGRIWALLTHPGRVTATMLYPKCEACEGVASLRVVTKQLELAQLEVGWRAGIRRRQATGLS